MCGILGIVSLSSAGLSRAAGPVERLRDLMAHRGPDGAGLWRDPSAVLAHRRLAVIDPTPAGDQPRTSADGRWVIVYCGELYNDAEVRADLSRRGVVFRTACDTETLAEAISAWGESAVARLRGMYAFAAYNRVEQRLLLARDPLGIKPLYWWRGVVDGAPTVLFASEVRPIVEHPAVGARPDLAVVSAYLTTIRTTLGERTLFEGVRTLLPGQRIVFEPAGERIIERRGDWGAEHAPRARLAAEAIGTEHVEVTIDRSTFLENWDDQIERYGLPLSTPNEVAIRLVSRAIRAAGCVVALSGEGADELFAGYEHAVRAAVEFESSDKGGSGWSERAARFQVESNAWVPPGLKGSVLSPVACSAAEGDAAIFEHYRQELEGLRDRYGAGGVACHLGLHRRVNLAGLLLRLDQATMLERVEGRTPLADQDLCLLAESLSPGDWFRLDGGVFEGKRVLRRAFADRVPAWVLTRPKASFPLPFQAWMAGASSWLEESAWARDVFRERALSTVAVDPGRLWRIAWPTLNLARWGRRWWG